jgi:hypothetical protein
MNQAGHIRLLGASALLALLAMACEGHISDVETDHLGTASALFDHGTATSSYLDGLIVTVVHDGSGALVASAEWQLDDLEGRIEIGQQSLVTNLAPGTELTLGLANLATYHLWADQTLSDSAGDIPYDRDCRACTSGCCSCEGGEYCCLTQICFLTDSGTFEFQMDCGGSCGEAPGGSHSTKA